VVGLNEVFGVVYRGMQVMPEKQFRQGLTGIAVEVPQRPVKVEEYMRVFIQGGFATNHQR
jgi:hypothetical protein